jgi:hypothetical protein
MGDNTYKDIASQIKRMKDSLVEPEAVYMDSDTSRRLHHPEKIGGVSVEVDDGMKGWYVR